MRRILTSLSIVTMLVLTGCTGWPNGSPTPAPTKTVTKTLVRRETVVKTLPPKVVVKTVPGPVRTVVKTRTVIKYVSRSLVRAPLPPAPASHPGGAAACIRHWESGGNYRAQNPSSSASGAYQFLDSTWQSVTGLPGRAMNYPPATQDAAFWKLWANGNGRSQWVTGYHC